MEEKRGTHKLILALKINSIIFTDERLYIHFRDECKEFAYRMILLRVLNKLFSSYHQPVFSRCD